MINFEQLEVEGGLSFKDKVTFPLKGQGLTCILGKNLDDTGSNGSGKSSIGELLTHVLYATTAKGLKKADIVCDMGTQGYLGNLKFINGETKYEVVQSRSHAKEGTVVRLLANGKDLGIKGLNESQEAVKKAFGLSFEEYHSTTYLSQQMKHLFIRSTENDAKKSMLARIFSLNYQAMKDEADTKLKDTRVALLALKSNISSTKASLEAALLELGSPEEEELQTKIAKGEAYMGLMKKEIQELNDKLSAYMNYKITIAKAENYRKLLEQQALELKIALPGEDVSQYVVGIDNHLAQLEESLKTTRLHSKYYRDLIPHIENRDRMQEAFKAYESWPAEYRDMGTRNEDLQGLNNRMSNLNLTYGNLEGFDNLELLKANPVKEITPEELKTVADEKVDYYVALSGLNNDIAAENRRLQASANGVCVSCGQAITEEYIAKLKEDLARLEIAREATLGLYNNAQKKEQLYQGMQNDFNNWKKSIENLKAFEGTTKVDVIKEKEKLEQSIQNLKEEMTQVSQYTQAYQALQPYLAIEGEVQTTRSHLQGLEDNEKTMVELIPRFQNYRNTLNEYASCKVARVEEIDELAVKARTSQLQDESVLVAGQVASTKKDLETLRGITFQLNAIKGKEEEISKLEQQEQIFESLGYAFGPKGLIVERLGTICEYMNEKSNYFLSKIMKDIRLQFGMDGDSIDLDILINGKTRGTGNLSGGEGAKVGLACMLGLRSLIPDKNQTNLLVLDEVEANFDDRVRFELMDLLRSTLENTSLDSILMVTHSQALQDSMDWDNRWLVTKQGGCSTLEIK